MVGVAGFEPATSASQTRRDNRATLHPDNVIIFFYSLLEKYFLPSQFALTAIAERQGFEPWVSVSTYDDLANRSFRPLRHLSSNLFKELNFSTVRWLKLRLQMYILVFNFTTISFLFLKKFKTILNRYIKNNKASAFECFYRLIIQDIPRVNDKYLSVFV